MENLLSGKVAIITGGTRGIGRAIVKRFLQSGSSVALIGTNPEVGQEALSEMEPFLKGEQKCLFFQLDVSKTEEVDTTFKEILNQFGKIDVLVNNAGITKDNLLLKLSEEEWDKVLTVNLKSIYNTSKAAMRPMLKARSGKIINVTSVVGLIGNAGQTNYAASKAGIIGFSKSLAKELASRNININCIAPGFIKTQMTDVLTDAQKESLLSQIPLNRLGQPEDIANAALFLASPLADYITGQVITVDGGMVMS